MEKYKKCTTCDKTVTYEDIGKHGKCSKCIVNRRRKTLNHIWERKQMESG